MGSTAVVSATVDEEWMQEATRVCADAGMTLADAIRMLLLRTVADHALPFDPLIPNAETIAAMRAAERGELLPVASIDDLFLHADD